jgi:hypothetical protein
LTSLGSAKNARAVSNMRSIELVSMPWPVTVAKPIVSNAFAT